MIAIRRAEERGHFGQGWVDTYHTFSFDRYRDPEHTGFRKLLALNDERVDPGFNMPHRTDANVEIISYVLEGALEERDSAGTSTFLKPGELRRVSADSGQVQDEVNPSSDSPVRFLQFWLKPAQAKHSNSKSEQRHFSDDDKRGRLRLVASNDGRDGSLRIATDTDVYASVLAEGDELRHRLAASRHAWVQVARGSIRVNGRTLTEGDGAAISLEAEIDIRALSAAEVVVFDLA